MKRPFLSLAGLLVVATVIAIFQTPLPTILSYQFWPSYPQNESQTLRLRNLKEPATIAFDDFGIPHIEAKNLEDLSRSIGFIQARYRGFQMDLLRKLAAGRLAELLGDQKALDSTTVAFDLAMRGWDFRKRAKFDYKDLPEIDRKILRAYSDGVNQGMERFPSIEHEILGTKPEPWKGEDTILVGLLQAWSLTHNWEQEALRLSLALERGLSVAKEVYPFDPLYSYGTIKDADPSAKLPPPYGPESAAIVEEYKNKVSDVKRKSKEHFAFGDLAKLRPFASNAWVVGSKLSASGKPILHNDMHLTHQLPSLIFLQHIKMPGLNAVGAAMPGLPFLISGFNGRVAWGVTSSVADVADLVFEKNRLGCPIKTEKVSIKVKDAEDRSFELRRSCNGPIFNDMYPGYFSKAAPLVAIRFKTPKIQESLGLLYRANKAKSVHELRETLMRIPAPIQNIMAADMEGNIAFFSTGSVPLRKNHRGVFPAPGWLEEYEWKGWTPPKEMPLSFNPHRGYLLNSNNLVHNPYENLPVFHVDAAASHRFDRSTSALEALPIKDQDSLQSMQLDVYLERAKKLLPFFLKAISSVDKKDETQKQAFLLLKNWDLQADKDSAGAALFNSMYKNAIRVGLKNIGNENFSKAFLKQRYSPGVADVWFEKNEHIVWDDPKTKLRETRKEQLATVFKSSVEELSAKFKSSPESWKWGDLHFIKPKHPFGAKKVLSFFNLASSPLDGSFDSLWKAHFNLSDEDNFRVVAGPVYRFSIDLAEPEKAGFSTDTGASGWPLSPHYSDQYKKWMDGELIPIERDFQKATKEASAVMELVP